MSQAETRDSKEMLLPVRDVFKTFSLNVALKGVSLNVGKGEALALIGGSGAGKSALMKIIMDTCQPDGGGLVIADEKIHSFRPSVILARGVYMIPQEPIFFPSMAVGENVLTGFREKTGTLRKRLLQIMGDIGRHLDLNRKAMSLSIAEQQLAELLRGLLRNARVLTLDKSTNTLTFDEVESLFRIVENLGQKGIGVVYITHRLTEVFQTATHVATTRDGITTLKGRVLGFTREMLVKELLPPNTDVAGPKGGEGKGKTLNYEGLRPVFEPQDYTGYGLEDVNLKTYLGKVLGMAGVVSTRHTELVTTILRRNRVLRGKTILDGRDITGRSAAQVLEAGINYVPKNRKLGGLFVTSDVAANATSSLLRDEKIGGFFLSKKIGKKMTGRYIDDFRIKVTGQDQIAGSLSGRNQQKIIIDRSLSISPKLMILDEPTRGIDAVMRGDVYSIIHKLKARGVAIMLISPDMEEIVELSDRAVVIFPGRVKDELTRAEVSQASLTVTSFGMTEE